MPPPSPHYVLRVKLHLERWRCAVGMLVRGSARLALGNRQREDRPRQHGQRRKRFIISRCLGQHPTMASMLLVSASMAATRQWPMPWLDDPPSRLRHRTGRGVLRHLKSPAAPECAPRTPLFSGPQPSGSPRLTSGRPFVTLRPWKRTLSDSDSGPTALSYQLAIACR